MPRSVEIPKDKFVPLSKRLLVKQLSLKFENDVDRNLFLGLCSSLEAYLAALRLEQVETVKETYSPFLRWNESAAAEIATSTLEELENRQTRLLYNIWQIFENANFTPISDENYQSALTSVYLSDLPIRVDWPKLDVHLLSSFYAKNPEMSPFDEDSVKPPPFYQHFGLFYRGIGVMVKKEFFIWPKINLLTGEFQSFLKRGAIECWTQLSGRLYESLTGIPTDDDDGAEAKEKDSMISAAKSLLIAYKQKWQESASSTVFIRDTLLPSDAVEDDDEEDELKQAEERKEEEPEADVWYDENAVHKTAQEIMHVIGDKRYFTRISLADTLRVAYRKYGVGGVIQWMCSRAEIQEPTYSRLVVLHRSLPEGLLQEKLRRAKETSKRLTDKLHKKLDDFDFEFEATAKKMSSTVESGVSSIKSTLGDAASKLGDHYSDASKLAASVGTTVASTGLMQPSMESLATAQHIGGMIQSALKPVTDLSASSMQQSVSTLLPASEVVQHLHEPIRVQYFADVPISDLEVVFPCKRLSLKTFDAVYLWFVIVGGLYYLVREIVSTHFDTITTAANGNGNGGEDEFGSEQRTWHFMAIMGILTLMLRALLWWRGTEAAYNAALTKGLYDANIGTDLNAVLSLVDECCEQEMLESILAYFTILKAKAPVTEAEIDAKCEQLLCKEFGEDLHLEICDSVAKLKLLGLVTVEGETGNMNVLPPFEALEHVHELWTERTASFERLRRSLSA